MVEAMFEMSPDYFRQFQKRFIFFTCDHLPVNLSTHSAYAYAYHNESVQFDFCSKINHYHVVLDAAAEENLMLQVFSIPCLYTCYKYLISMLEEKSLKGEIYTKLQRAVHFNKTKHLDKISTASVRKLLPVSNAGFGKSFKWKRFEAETFSNPNRVSEFNYAVTI